MSNSDFSPRSSEDTNTIRTPVLERYKAVWLTSGSYELLRIEKLRQGKTIMQLVDDLIQERYNNKNI